MLEAFVSKSILYVYQNVRWNQIKIVPKIYQNIPPKKKFIAWSGPPLCGGPFNTNWKNYVKIFHIFGKVHYNLHLTSPLPPFIFFISFFFPP